MKLTELLADRQLSAQEKIVILALGQSGVVSLALLSRATGLSKSTVYRVVRHLRQVHVLVQGGYMFDRSQPDYSQTDYIQNDYSQIDYTLSSPDHSQNDHEEQKSSSQLAVSYSQIDHSQNDHTVVKLTTEKGSKDAPRDTPEQDERLFPNIKVEGSGDVHPPLSPSDEKSNKEKDAREGKRGEGRDDLFLLRSFWNETCAMLPKVMSVDRWTEARKTHASAFLRSVGSLDAAKLVFERVARSDFLTGVETRWKADFDWVLKPSNLLKIQEGKYDNVGGGLSSNEWVPPPVEDGDARF